MGCGIDPKVDYAFKRVFGSEENRNVLRHLLNAILAKSLLLPIEEVLLLNPFSQKDAADDRLSVLDIKAKDGAGREYIIEMQLFAQASFPERLLYYGAKHYSQQLAEGDDYSNLRPVIVICFVNAVLFRELPGYHSCFELVDARHGGRFTDQFAIHLVELPKYIEAAPVDNDADRWAYFLKHGEEWEPKTLPSFLSAPEFLQASRTLAMLAQSDLERELYEARLKHARDERARTKYVMDTSLAEGRAEGLAQGLSQGRDEGRDEGRAREAQNLILRLGTRRLGSAPESVVQAIQATTSVEKLEDLADRIVDVSNWDEFVAAGLP